MSTSEITRSELVSAVVGVSALLTGPRPLAERMQGLCAAAADVLRCDHISIVLIDGESYRGAFSFGYTPELAEAFREYKVSREKPIIREIERCATYLLYNNAKRHPAMARIAKLVGVESVVIVPFSHTDGSPFGYLTVDYVNEKRTISIEEAELAMGLARLAQSTLLRDHELQRRREISLAMLAVEENERRRLSTELHDDPLQRILGLRLGLESFQDRIDDPEAKAEVARFIEQCRGASASLREVMVRTHPTATDVVDLESTLRSLVARLSTTTEVEFIFGDLRTLKTPPFVTAAISRVAEQAVRNALQHAASTKLRVTLCDETLGSSLTVIDNGRGFDPSSVEAGHLGLVSMRERVEALGGRFMIESSPRSGTAITAWIPHR